MSDWSSYVCASDLRVQQLFRILPFTRNTQRNSVATQDFRIARPAVQRQFIFPLRPFRIARQVQRQAPVGRNVGVLDAKARRILEVTQSLSRTFPFQHASVRPCLHPPLNWGATLGADE